MVAFTVLWLACGVHFPSDRADPVGSRDTLEPDPELPLGDSPAPRERLVFAFSTADVVVFGARLAFLVDLIRDHKLTAVWPLGERYRNLEPSQPFVSAIAIRPLSDKSKDAAS
jgi:hypothetical protein